MSGCFFSEARCSTAYIEPFHTYRNRAMAVGSVYNVNVLSMSRTGVKNAVWSPYTSFVHNVLGL